MTDVWVTYAPDLAGNWLMQGWEIVDGTVTKIAEQALTYPYPPAPGAIDNDYYELVEHPRGGVAFVGWENDGNLSLTRFTIEDGVFVQASQVVAETGTYGTFIVTANYIVLRPPYPNKGTFAVLSLHDLSAVTTFDPEALGLDTHNMPFLNVKGVVGDTLYFLDDSGTYQWAKGVNLTDGTPHLVTLAGTPTSAGDAYVRLSSGLKAQRRDRWMVYPGKLVQGWTTDSGVYLDSFWAPDHTLIDADGNLTTVQFPAVDGQFTALIDGVRVPVTPGATQWFFGEPASNGDIVASWVGYAQASPPPGPGTAPAGPHRFHGSVTIPNGGGTVTTTCVDDGLCGSTISGDNVADSAWVGRATTSFSAAVGLREDPAFSPNAQPYTWYSINPNRVVTDLQTVDPYSESVPNLFFSYTSNAPYGLGPPPPLAASLSAGLGIMGQMFDRRA